MVFKSRRQSKSTFGANKITGTSLYPDNQFGQFRFLNLPYRMIKTNLQSWQCWPTVPPLDPEVHGTEN